MLRAQTSAPVTAAELDHRTGAEPPLDADPDAEVSVFLALTGDAAHEGSPA